MIIGARTATQLDDNLAATEVAIPPDVLARLNDVSTPTPEYPGSFVVWIQRGLDPTDKR